MKEITAVRIMVGDEEIIVDGYVHYHVDTKYGADADGGRGERRTFIDDVTDVDAITPDGEDYKLNEVNFQRAIDALQTKFLEG